MTFKRIIERNLTETEIEDVLENIPLLPAPYDFVGEFMRNQLIHELRYSLQKIKLNINAYQEFKDLLREHIYRALVYANSATGELSAVGLGEPLQQALLSAIHSLGKKGEKGSVVKGIKSLLSATEFALPTVTIHFKDKNKTKEEAYRFCSSLDAINLKYISTSYGILNSIPLGDESWVKNYLLTHNLPENLLSYKSGYGSEVKSLNKNFLRIELNINICFKHNLSIYDICKTLSAKKYKIKHTICSPMSKGIIYLIPDDIELENYKTNRSDDKESLSGFLSEDDAKYKFLNTVFVTEMQNIVLGGIKGLLNSRPEEISLSTKIKNIKMKSPNTFEYEIQKEALVFYFGPEKYEEYFKALGFEILENNCENYTPTFLVKTDKDFTSKDELLTYVNKKIEYAKDSYREKIIEVYESEGPYEIPEAPRLYRAAFYVYCLANGVDVVHKLKFIHFIDPHFVSTNSIKEMWSIGGIISVEHMMLKTYYELIKRSDSNSNPHIFLPLVGTQCFPGFVIAVSSSGAVHMSSNTLSAAAIQNPLDHIKKAAASGKRDSVNTISSCVITGQLPYVGTGCIKLKNYKTDKKITEDMIYEKVGRKMISKKEKEGNEDNRELDFYTLLGDNDGNTVKVTEIDAEEDDFSQFKLKSEKKKKSNESGRLMKLCPKDFNCTILEFEKPKMIEELFEGMMDDKEMNTPERIAFFKQRQAELGKIEEMINDQFKDNEKRGEKIDLDNAVNDYGEIKIVNEKEKKSRLKSEKESISNTSKEISRSISKKSEKSKTIHENKLSKMNREDTEIMIMYFIYQLDSKFEEDYEAINWMIINNYLEKGNIEEIGDETMKNLLEDITSVNSKQNKKLRCNEIISTFYEMMNEDLEKRKWKKKEKGNKIKYYINGETECIGSFMKNEREVNERIMIRYATLTDIDSILYKIKFKYGYDIELCSSILTKNETSESFMSIFDDIEDESLGNMINMSDEKLITLIKGKKCICVLPIYKKIVKLYLQKIIEVIMKSHDIDITVVFLSDYSDLIDKENKFIKKHKVEETILYNYLNEEIGIYDMVNIRYTS